MVALINNLLTLTYYTRDQRICGKRRSRPRSVEYLESSENMRIFRRRYIVGILTNKTSITYSLIAFPLTPKHVTLNDLELLPLTRGLNYPSACDWRPTDDRPRILENLESPYLCNGSILPPVPQSFDCHQIWFGGRFLGRTQLCRILFQSIQGFWF